MKKLWLLIVGVIVSVPLSSQADTVKMDAPPKVEESSPEADKAAANAASSDADKWTGTQKTTAVKSPDAPAAVQPPVAASPAAVIPVAVPVPAKPPMVHQKGLNEMQGKFQSHGDDPRSLRVMVDGGYNVEFTYDGKTTITNGGSQIGIDDLNYGDEVVVRYSGKELYAIEIERLSQVPRPQ